MATVGELVVNLRAATAAFSNDLDKATKLSFDSARQIERSFSTMTTMVRAAVLSAVTSLGFMIERVTEAAHQIELASQRTGLSIESFQGLSGAAKLAGVDVESFTVGMGRLAKNLYAAQTGNEKMAAAFRMAGVDVTKVKSTEEVIYKLSDTFSKLADGRIDKVGLGMTIMGRGASVFMPFLSQSPAALRSLVEELKSLGYVIDEQNIRQLAEQREKIEKLQMAWEGIQRQIVVSILPTLQELAKTLLDMAKGGDFKAFIEGAIFGFKALATAAVVVGTEIRNLIYDFKLLTMPIKNLPSLGEIEAQYRGNYLAAQQRIDRIGLWAAPTAPIAGEAAAPKIAPPQDIKDLIVVNDKAQKSFEQLVNKINEESLAFQYGARYAEVYKLTMQGLSTAQIRTVLSMQDQVAAMKALPGLLDPVIHGTEELDTSFQEMRERGARYWEDTLTPLNKLYIAMQDLNDIYAAGAIDTARYNDALAHMRAEYDKLLDEHPKLEKTRDLVDRLQKSFVNAFGNAVFGAETFRDAIKNLLLEIGRMIFEVNVMVPLVEKLTAALRNLGKTGTGGGGGFGILGTIFGSLFGGGGGGGGGGGALSAGGYFAAGGIALPGHSYVVGEEGPEILQMGLRGGRVIPLAGAGGQTIVNIDARGADAGVEERIRRVIRQESPMIVRQSVAAMTEQRARTVGRGD